jgi:hypothetical protein
MDAISNSDRFVALLRQKLADRARIRGTDAKPRTDARALEDTAPQRSIATLAAMAGADDRKLRRTIVAQLLTERMGDQLVNEPRFQQIIEQVTELIADDAELGSLLGEVMKEVRG